MALYKINGPRHGGVAGLRTPSAPPEAWGDPVTSTSTRAVEHIREGLFLFSIGRVLEGRREWRRALSLEPDHPEALDFLVSTDSELSEADLTREQQEGDEAAAGPPSDSRETMDGWTDDEITSEVSGRWRRRGREDLEHTRVTPPGERPMPPSAHWEIEAEAGWDPSEEPLEGEGLAAPESGAAQASASDESWLNDTQAGEEAIPSDWGQDDPLDETAGGFTADTVEGLLGRAVSAFHDGDYKAARAHLNALLELDPDSTAALSYIDQLDDRLREQLQGGSIPERTIGMDEVEAIKLDLVGGYLMSLIDGQTTIDDIFALSAHLDESEVLRILASLLEQGIIRLRSP